ncbi:hypothetical protein B0T26DRAFT_749377 [Lasiosphaeria miniovina]|uniref:Uncharacterized protein n=1 Tax=Lasiosphaeria miniovina TaxID=1954250 RepID=A0AA40ATX7_9PEZI|nr:uncharacterized protein B0T26DRAFT_749377 [Lasiosphaeria miniovina]KAK0721913.1 hypothetical protein B0T26DRAFT_749377 [Lasiosphaeria miniovina]
MARSLAYADAAAEAERLRASGSTDMPPPPKLQVKHFKLMDSVTVEFEEYMKKVFFGQTPADLAREAETRVDRVPGQSWTTGHQSGKGSGKTWAKKYAAEHMNITKELLADKYEIFFKTLGEIGLSELKNTPFSARSEVVKAHPLHRLYDDDDRCNGWSVGIVVHPAVVGFGSSDGRDYSKSMERVWMKAEAFLSETV